MLIKCPECGKEISDKSKQCIYCGFPLEEQEQTNDDICIVNGVPVDLSFVLKEYNNGKSFSRIAKNAEITINIPKSKAFFVIAGRSVNNAGKNIYAGSSNASGIYSFYKITGLDEQITESNDKEAITFTSNTWMEVIYVFV